MSEQPSDKDLAIWRRLVDSHQAFTQALTEFFSEGVDRVALVRGALRSEDIFTALHVAAHYMKSSELMQLFDQLVLLASTGHGAVDAVRKIILSLPRDWVLAHIEEAVEPLLRDGTYDEYRRFLELYEQLDQNLALNLRAHQPDPRDLLCHLELGPAHQP